jgi:DNA-binding FadR family transcriptional regulator
MALATTTFLTISKAHRSLSVIAERHILVLEALRARDPDAAEAAMRSHIDEPGQWLRAALEEEQAQKRQKLPRARRAARRKAAG